MHVNNVAPTIAISGAASVNEGSLYSLTLGAVTDPGTDTVSSYVVHWGDGSSDTYTSNGVKTHTYADGPNACAITVDLVDEDGTFNRQMPAPFQVHVNNVAPTIAIAGGASVNEGSVYSLTLGAVTDPGTDTVTSYVVHWGDGGSDTYTTQRRQDPHLRRRPQRLRHHGRPGRRGRHLHRRQTPAPFQVHVNNVAPTVAISGQRQRQRGLELTA